jgi:hypothetical protein
MNKHQPSMMDVLCPPNFQAHPLRQRVTRTILQPEIDKFEQMEAEGDRACHPQVPRARVSERSRTDLVPEAA